MIIFIIRSIKIIILIVIFGVLISCGGGGSSSDSNNGEQNTEYSGDAEEVLMAEIEDDLHQFLDQYDADTNFTIIIKTESGHVLQHSIGTSTENTSYESASSSKMVAATVILSVVQAGGLSLEDSPQDHISFWPDNGDISTITLRDLLSFTSGLINEPLCVHLPNRDFAECVETIMDNNNKEIDPGSSFYYASTHLQVAALMAVNASGNSSWEELFQEFKDETSLFQNSQFDLPSSSNPRIAGGMHYTANDYMEFLEALYFGDILNQDLINEMTKDQISSATIEYTPTTAVSKDWHYGFGLWVECDGVPYNCETPKKISSAGAYGTYPFINFNKGYYGIVARQGDLGTFPKGVILFESIEDDIEEWVDLLNSD